MTHGLLTLAFQEWIGIAIFAIIAIVGVIGKAREAQQQQRQQREERGLGVEASAPAETSARARLDEVAQRRRRQLQELAERRRAALQARTGGETRRPGAQPGAENPTNLTVAEQEARVRAKVEYERRAAALRARQAAEVQQRQAQTQAGAQAERRAPAAKTRARPASTPTARPTRPAPSTFTRERADERGPVLVLEEDEPVRRNVTDMLPEPVAAASPVQKLLGRVSWREAVILKEILDPPLALRSEPRW